MHTLRRILFVALTGIALGAVALVVWLHWPRPGPAPMDVATTAADGATTVTWLGVSGALLRKGDSAVMIDPFFTRRPDKLGLVLNRPVAPDEARVRAWLKRLGVQRLDAVAVSHSHYDHALDAGLVARLTGARLVGSASTANIGRGAGLPESRIVTVAPGMAVDAGAFTLRFHPSRHAGATGGRPRGTIDAPLTPPATALAYRLGGAWSIAVTHPDGSVLHHGSAGFEPGALRAVRADTVLLGVAMIDDLPRYLAAVVDTVDADQVYAVHWDDFTRPLSAPLQPLPLGVDLPGFLSAARAARPGIRFATLPLGQPVSLAR